MNEVFADLWGVNADLRVITTNGFVKKNHEAVMGRGCAREAADKYPLLPTRLGSLIRAYGNRTMLLGEHDGVMLCALPVKHHWREQADIELIERSVMQLAEIVQKYQYAKVVLPRPGCGNGGLDWQDVSPVIEPYLDRRYTVVAYPSEAA